jgi:hypothetical protein
LFFDLDNKSDHDALIQKEEARGYTLSSDRGRPIDPEHPWN